MAPDSLPFLATHTLTGALFFPSGIFCCPDEVIIFIMVLLGPVIMVPCSVFFGASIEGLPLPPPNATTAAATTVAPSALIANATANATGGGAAAASSTSSSTSSAPNLFEALSEQCTTYFPPGFDTAYLDLFR
jgi:hypothetical protein